MEPELELTREQVIERIEREARRRMGLSAREFLMEYQRGPLLHLKTWSPFCSPSPF